jgi:hypothetical protein
MEKVIEESAQQIEGDFSCVFQSLFSESDGGRDKMKLVVKEKNKIWILMNVMPRNEIVQRTQR